MSRPLKGDKILFSTRDAYTWIFVWKKINHQTTYKEINLKWIIDLNRKGRTIKFLKLFKYISVKFM